MRPIDADALIPIMKYTTTDNEIGVFPIRIGFDAIKEVIDEAPTIEPTDTDLISRQDAIEMAVDVETPQGTYERAIYVDDLMALPSADTDMSEYCDRLWKIAYERGKAETEAKTGEWVEHTGGISHELYYFCDQCYGEVDTNDYNFCPNCGARMKGGDTE